MSSSREYAEYITDQLSELDGIALRKMMGDYIVYYKGKVAGGIFDDRLLIKAVPSAVAFVKTPEYAIPYPTGKPMLFIDNVDDRWYLKALFEAIYDEIEYPKKNYKKSKKILDKRCKRV